MTSEEALDLSKTFDDRLEGLEDRLDLAQQITASSKDALHHDDLLSLIRYSSETFAMGVKVVADMLVRFQDSLESNAKVQLRLAKEIAAIKRVIQEAGDVPPDIRDGDEWKFSDE